MAKNLLKVLFLSSALLFTGCYGSDKEKEEVKENNPIEIKVGEQECFGFSSQFPCMIYAGMNSESSFSLADAGHNGANFYYPKSSEIVNYKGYKFDVISVTPEKIILFPIGKDKK